MDNQELIDSLIDNILDGKASEAEDQFKNLISTKVNSALDTKKQEIAHSLFSNATDEQENIEQEEQETQ